MKIDDQPDGYIQQFHVTEQLGLVDGQNLLHALEFQQETILDQNIKSKRLIEDQSFVFDSDDALIDRFDPEQLQLPHQTAFINALNQTGSLEPVNFDGRANGGVA